MSIQKNEVNISYAIFNVILHPCLICVLFIIAVVLCYCFDIDVPTSVHMFMFHVHTNKHTHTRAYIQISFIISAYLSPLQGQWWIHFQRPFHYTNTYSHTHRQSHMCGSLSSRVAFNSSLRHGWSIAWLYVLYMYVCVGRSLPVPVYLQTVGIAAWMCMCACAPIDHFLVW